MDLQTRVTALAREVEFLRTALKKLGALDTTSHRLLTIGRISRGSASRG